MVLNLSIYTYLNVPREVIWPQTFQISCLLYGIQLLFCLFCTHDLTGVLNKHAMTGGWGSSSCWRYDFVLDGSPHSVLGGNTGSYYPPLKSRSNRIRTHSKARGQHSELGSRLLSWVQEIERSSSDLHSRHFALWAISWALLSFLVLSEMAIELY